MDKFLNLQNSRERLLKNYKEHQGLIIAFDFDNTVFNPETGDTQGCEDVE